MGSALLLATLVALAAGVAGEARFSGPRWVPHIELTLHLRARPRPPALRTTGSLRLPPSRGPARFTLGALLLWIAVAIVILVVAVQLWRWWCNRRSRAASLPHAAAAGPTRAAPAMPEPEPDAPALRSGIERALELLDEDREPADAIIRAWLGLQETAQQSGIVRRPAETPTEFTTRILTAASADDRALRTLLALYLRARFGAHPATREDLAAVRVALQTLLRTWPVAGAPTAGAAAR